MSIRSNPMKAVPLLLKRVKATRTKLLQTRSDYSFDVKMEMLTRVLIKIEDVFMRVKRNQDELLDALHDVDGLLRKPDTNRLDQDMPVICQRITDCAHKLLPMDHFDEDQIVESSSHDPSSSKHNSSQLQLLPQTEGPTWYQLTPHQQSCLLKLKYFPKDGVIKKRLAIYLWIGWRVIRGTKDKTAEEMGEEVIDEFLKLNVIVPYGNANCPIVNKFQIHPRFRPRLDSALESQGLFWNPFEAVLLLRQRNVMISVKSMSTSFRKHAFVFNVSSSYLNFGAQWLDKESYLQVLQLGHCQDSPSHHIEVVNQDFLNNLRNQNYLTYLSLSGISRVFELPPSITELYSLEILDLKACHNLETLPDDISSLQNLTHLMLSQCYLLDAMPRGIDKLHKLQVLKGFVLGNARKTPCKISDLAAQLKDLRRLSIHIATEAVIHDGEFESLGDFSKLKHLKISWDVFDKKYSEIQIKLPLSLKKLHVEGFPGHKIPEWLKPSEVPAGLKELNISGGKLESMEHHQDTNQWDMEIVRLKYVKYLEIDITYLQMLFPSLKYALLKPIPYHPYTEWSNWKGKPICKWSNCEPFPSYGSDESN